MKTSQKLSRSKTNGRRKSAAGEQTHTAERVRRPERIIYFLTQDELRQLFKVIRSKREGTRLRRDTVIPQWFQSSKAAAASDRHAVHC